MSLCQAVSATFTTGGVILEIVGLAITAHGVWGDWNRSNPDRSLMRTVWDRLLRRKSTDTHPVTAEVRIQWNVEADAAVARPELESLQQQVDWIETRVNEVETKAAAAARAADAALREAESVAAAAKRHAEGLVNELRREADRQQTQNAPLAAIGVGVTILGLILGTIGQLIPA